MIRISLFSRSVLLAVVVATVSCADSSLEMDENNSRTDGWDYANDPDRFGEDYVYDWDELKVESLKRGSATLTPWSGTYWPSVEDGYNARWQGADKLSPMELYDLAYGEWEPEGGVEEFLKLVPFTVPGEPYDSKYYKLLGSAATWAHTNRGNSEARVLTKPNGTPLWDVTSEKPYVEWGGLQSWFGHCFAWASASFTTPEPIRPVTKNGVTFQVSDIKALIAATYDNVQKRNLGGRCLINDIRRDENGRVVSKSCRDTNAGTFHVVLLNRMGIRGDSFVFDVTPTAQVWNQPARDYVITRQEEVLKKDAVALLGMPEAEQYPYNDEAKRFVHVNLTFRYVVEGQANTSPYKDYIDALTRTKEYEYLLELSQDGEILGGEWIGNSEHPDYMWIPYEARDVTTGWWGSTIIALKDVQELVTLSTQKIE